MGTTLDLQNKLKELLGSEHVYFQPPKNIRMEYPCFIVQRSKANHEFADNKVYRFTKCYSITYVSTDTDSDMVETVVNSFSMCIYDRPFISDNLNHDVFTLYW